MRVCTEVLGLSQACLDGGLNVPTSQQNLPPYPLPFNHKVGSPYCLLLLNLHPALDDP